MSDNLTQVMYWQGIDELIEISWENQEYDWSEAIKE